MKKSADSWKSMKGAEQVKKECICAKILSRKSYKVMECDQNKIIRYFFNNFSVSAILILLSPKNRF